MSVLASSRLFRPSSVVLLVLLAAGSGYSQSAPVEMRYKLAAGDRLVYREVFDREGKSPDMSFHARVVLTNQLVVVDEAAGRFLVGVQRNRLSAEVPESHERGKDTLAQQKPGFAQTMAKRPVRFYDTNLFATTGQMLLPPQVLREANSKLLYGIKGIMPLPVTPVQAGFQWDLGVFGLRMKLERFESVRTESCNKKPRHPKGSGLASCELIPLFCGDNSLGLHGRDVAAGNNGQQVGLHLVPLLNQESLRFKHVAN
jgi:hypothetical protein